MNSNPVDNNISKAHDMDPKLDGSTVVQTGLKNETFVTGKDFNFDVLFKNKEAINEEKFLKIEDFDFLENVFEIDSKFENIVKTLNLNNYSDKKIIKDKLDRVTLSSKKMEEFPSVGPVTSLEYFVEFECNHDFDKMGTMLKQIRDLSKYVNKWRLIMGDGNCFYRGVIFAFLENLIIEKNIFTLKNIIVEIYEKFSADYPNTARLQSSTRNQIYQMKKVDVFSIINMIIYYLDEFQTSPYGPIQAYNILVKAFLEFPDFDLAMVMYVRYKIYEYTLANSTKTHSPDYDVVLGNLLPKKYETDNNGFDFNSYFEEELLKLGVEAEMIAVHITPYVLKVDLILITYDFISFEERLKLFPSYLLGKPKIALLLRGVHYDLIYEKSYFIKNENVLKEYSNCYENFQILVPSFVDEYCKSHNLTNPIIEYPKKPLSTSNSAQSNVNSTQSSSELFSKLFTSSVEQAAYKQNDFNQFPGDSMTDQELEMYLKALEQDAKHNNINNFGLQNLGQRQNNNTSTFNLGSTAASNFNVGGSISQTQKQLLKTPCKKCNLEEIAFNDFKLCVFCMSNAIEVGLKVHLKNYISYANKLLNRNELQLLNKDTAEKLIYDNNILVSGISVNMLELRNIGLPIETLVRDCLSRVCICCNTQIKSNKFYTFECGCTTCSMFCFEELMKPYSKVGYQLSNIKCLCTREMTIRDMKSLKAFLLNKSSLSSVLSWVNMVIVKEAAQGLL